MDERGKQQARFDQEIDSERQADVNARGLRAEAQRAVSTTIAITRQTKAAHQFPTHLHSEHQTALAVYEAKTEQQRMCEHNADQVFQSHHRAAHECEVCP